MSFFAPGGSTAGGDWGPNAEAAPFYVPYSPIVDRPRIEWPGGARVALWIAPNVESYEWFEPPNPYRTLSGRLPQPDVMLYGYRDYGNRVGFWRMLETLDRYAVRATVALNVAVLDQFPEVRDAMVERNWDYMAHGIFNSRFLFGMGVEEERDYLRDVIETVGRHTGKRLQGIFGPAGTVSPNTMELAAEAGILYTADWFLDDQPFPIRVRQGGKLVGVPYSIDINDGTWLMPGIGRYEADLFCQACQDQFDVLWAEGAESGRVMCIALHPWLIGAPHRAEYLDRALDYILGHEGVWLTTADEIAEHYVAHHYDAAVAHVPAA